MIAMTQVYQVQITWIQDTVCHRVTFSNIRNQYNTVTINDSDMTKCQTIQTILSTTRLVTNYSITVLSIRHIVIKWILQGNGEILTEIYLQREYIQID